MTAHTGAPKTGVLTVDLNALAHNWGVIGARLNDGVEIGAVIKANAYGLGAEPVGLRLYREGCRRFFFATFDEAHKGRGWLPADADVILLGGVSGENAVACLYDGITPVLYSRVQIEHWAGVCRAHQRTGGCWVKVDTGMTRMGLSGAEFDQLCREPECLAPAQPHFLMSHLACAEEPEHPLNEQQRVRFEQACQRFRVCFPEARRSLANSSGIFLGEPWHGDLVRPGAGLYGFAPQVGAANPFKPVVSLRLPVLQVREVRAPASVGYGALAEVKPPARLAVVAGGYADGLHRTIGLVGQGIYAGYPVQAIGRMSMDTTIFDISAVPPEAIVADGDYLTVLNDDLNVDVMTARTGGPGYDVLTSLGPRYRRRYLGEQ
ncbi:alanine racemase [Marinimicrobium alkaliphilum]|uniref:alanine racemase n=1 Tax=Marinimicrobium alkaliphilum TaxID=2202654 RepID=UPI000DB9700F|nr:alanine racemase [Marinimicrobium alkaliphilum]